MPHITGDAALDVLIGLFFLYFVLSIVCSAVNELIQTGLSARADKLEAAIHGLLDDRKDDFYDSPRIRALWKKNGRKPSYIPSRAFALAVLDLFAPPTGTKNLIQRAEASVATLPSGIVKTFVQDALGEADGDVERFRTSLEKSYEDAMERVSGWYKRRVQLFLVVIAAVVAGGLNADSIGVAQRLWQDPALRSAVVAQATSSSACPTTASPQTAANCVEGVKAIGIPLGWSSATEPSGGWNDLWKALGLLITVAALSLGAPFWFDALGQISNLRGAGKPPAASSSS